LLCAGGAGFVTALIGTLAGSSRTAQAQALASKPPEVDSLAVRIVTDNQIIKFIPTEKRDGLTIERKPGGYLSKDTPPRAELVGEWGLSMHAESRRGSEVRMMKYPRIAAITLAIAQSEASRRRDGHAATCPARRVVGRRSGSRPRQSLAQVVGFVFCPHWWHTSRGKPNDYVEGLAVPLWFDLVAKSKSSRDRQDS
jgi:hypothetical protein